MAAPRQYDESVDVLCTVRANLYALHRTAFEQAISEPDRRFS
jgi:hypothetical protein